MPGRTEIPLSGLHAAQRRQEAAAHNTSNAATDGFSRQRVTARESSTGGVRARVDTVELSPSDHEISESLEGPQNDVDPASESVERIVAGRSFEANVRVLRTQDRLAGSLLDIFV